MTQPSAGKDKQILLQRIQKPPNSNVQQSDTAFDTSICAHSVWVDHITCQKRLSDTNPNISQVVVLRVRRVEIGVLATQS